MSKNLSRTVNAVSSDNIWWWLDNGYQCGSWHMAADQFFTEHMKESGRPVMRVYQWRPWCISLGYHQSEDCLDLNLCREVGIDIVRRQTGGRAVLHAEELTYSIILPRGHVLAASVAYTYRRLSEGLASGLRKLGVPATFQKQVVDLRSHYAAKISAGCFSAASLHEIVVCGKKLVGSAQKRTVNGVLQHGSILIGSAHLKLFHFLNGLSPDEKRALTEETTEKTATIGSVLESRISPEQISEALREGMAETFAIEFQQKSLSDEEIKEIEKRRVRFSLLENPADSGNY